MGGRPITYENVDAMHEQQYHDMAGPAGVTMADAAGAPGIMGGLMEDLLCYDNTRTGACRQHGYPWSCPVQGDMYRQCPTTPCMVTRYWPGDTADNRDCDTCVHDDGKCVETVLRCKGWKERGGEK